MIKLEVEEYCHDCEDFEPECEKSCMYANYGILNVKHIVRCVNYKKCRNLHAHIKLSSKKEKENALFRANPSG